MNQYLDLLFSQPISHIATSAAFTNSSLCPVIADEAIRCNLPRMVTKVEYLRLKVSPVMGDFVTQFSAKTVTNFVGISEHVKRVIIRLIMSAVLSRERKFLRKAVE